MPAFSRFFSANLSQVLGFATFFALVLKKVDQEEYGEPQIDENLRNPGKSYFLLPLLALEPLLNLFEFVLQILLMQCGEGEETAHVVSISRHLPLTLTE